MEGEARVAKSEAKAGAKVKSLRQKFWGCEAEWIKFLKGFEGIHRSGIKNPRRLSDKNHHHSMALQACSGFTGPERNLYRFNFLNVKGFCQLRG